MKKGKVEEGKEEHKEKKSVWIRKGVGDRVVEHEELKESAWKEVEREW